MEEKRIIKLNEARKICDADIDRWEAAALSTEERKRLAAARKGLPTLDQQTELARRTGMLRNDWNVHQKRVRSDPLYCWYLFPCATVSIPFEETEFAILDKYLQDVMEYVHKGYHIDTENSEYVAKGFSILRTTQNILLKRWTALMFAVIIPEAREWLEAYYNSGDSRYWFRGPDVFDNLCKHATTFFLQSVERPVCRESSVLMVAHMDKAFRDIWSQGFSE